MNRDELLKLLDDKEIQDAIKKIVSKNSINNSHELDEANKEIEVLEKLVAKLKSCLRKEEVKSNTLNQELKTKQEELSELNNTIKNAKTKLNKIETELSKANAKNNQLVDEVEDYKKQFDVELNMFKLYNNLSKETKTSLKGIFKDDSFEGFIACGLQEKNIHSLWDYIKSELIEDSNEDNENLVKIFNFFFVKYEMAYPIYKVQNIKKDEDFNTDLHIKDSQSSVSGKIKEVLLKGWVNTKMNNVVRKSVVNI